MRPPPTLTKLDIRPCSVARAPIFMTKRIKILKNAPTFSTIRTPSSYPASQKPIPSWHSRALDLRVTPIERFSLLVHAPSVSHRRESTSAYPMTRQGRTQTAIARIETDRVLALRIASIGIKERDDYGKVLARPKFSEYARRRENDLLALSTTFSLSSGSLAAHSSGKNVAKCTYARNGIVPTPEDGIRACRESNAAGRLSQNTSLRIHSCPTIRDNLWVLGSQPVDAPEVVPGPSSRGAVRLSPGKR